MAGVMQRSLCCFAVLAAVTFFTVQCANYTPEKPNVLNPATSATAKPASNPQIGVKPFLAGEDTPVWLAYWDDTNEEVAYKRFKNEIVKDAIHFWKTEGCISCKLRSTQITRWIDEELTEIAKKHETQAANHYSKIFQPSILAVMEHETIWPKNEVEQYKMILGRILYALSFFHGVDIHLRVLQRPEVRLRVAGIIICKDKRALPYINENVVGKKGHLAVMKTLHPMATHWRRTFDSNANFPSNAFDIVVTMTGSTPTSDSGSSIAVSSPEPYCGKTKEPAVALFVDHFDFSGLPAAVYEISRVLGADNHKGHSKYGSKECPIVPLQTKAGMKRTWSECSLDSVSKTLNTIGFCLEHAKEYYPPGKPIDPILPGKLMPASRQCKNRGWEDGIVCWKKMTCDKLYCENDNLFSRCKNSGPALDGTTCGKNRMCILGNCVSNTTLI